MGMHVTLTIIPVAFLILITILATTSLRRVAPHTRLAFDAMCFACFSGYFIWRNVFPVFPPLTSATDIDALSLRLLGTAWWLSSARLVSASLSFAFQQGQKSRKARLSSDLLSAVIYVAGILVVLNLVFAIPVTGVVATSGVVAIVLALALQNTLADVFSGVAVGIEAPFHVGDRIQLSNDLEGTVAEMNWRSIRIQTDGGDLAIIPNSVVAKAHILNRSYPTEQREGAIELTCPEHASPEHVIDCLEHATLLCPAILSTPAAHASLVKLGSRRNEYKVSFHVKTTKDLGKTKDALLRASRRQLHYAGWLDRNRKDDQSQFQGPPCLVLGRRLIKDAVLFESLSDDQIVELSHQLESRQLAPGDALFRQDQTDAALYLVGSGIVELSQGINGVAESLGCIGAGDYIGEIGLLTGASHAATATALTHALVWRLPHEAIAPLLDRHADLFEAFNKSAAKGLALLQRHVAAKATTQAVTSIQLLDRIRRFFGRL